MTTDWDELKQEYLEECCEGFHESHFMDYYYKTKLSADDLFNWFRNKLDTDTFCFICNEWHPEGECMKIHPLKGVCYVSTDTNGNSGIDILEIEEDLLE